VCAVGFAPTMLGGTDAALAEAVDYRGTAKLIAAAAAARLPGRFVLLSSLGVGSLDGATASPSARLLDASLGGVLRQKGRAEAALRESGLDWCVVRPGLLLQEAAQGGVLLGPQGRWTGDAVRDGAGLGPKVRCASPFLSSAGAVCAATRGQVADVCVAALAGDPHIFSRRVVEVVARPEASMHGFRVVGDVPPAPAGNGESDPEAQELEQSPERPGR
jgi:uncharacterized protein YbjT (DUF2867 family)